MASKLDEMQQVVRKKFKSDFNVTPKTKTDTILDNFDVMINNIKKAISSESEW